MEALKPGTKAPNFTLKSTPDQSVQLGDLQGERVILCFYPADWSPVCGDQLALYQAVLPEFKRLKAGLIAVSVDGVWCHMAYAKHRKLTFPLLSDFEPKGAVARAYGVYAEAQGTAGRALFVLDESGTIHWSHVSPLGVNPGADGILNALESMEGASQGATRS